MMSFKRAVSRLLMLLPLIVSDGLQVAHAASDLTFSDVVKRLYSLEWLAEAPADGERSGNWTSHDRMPYYDASSDSYRHWWASDDSSGFVRKEGSTGLVAAEAEGPGVIWRVWSAYPGTGHIKYFIDGSEAPVLDLPFADYFSSSKSPFAFPELTQVLSRGFNSYVPIPFQKSIKIVMEKDWGAFYQFSYTLFPKGTSVPSFRGSFNATERAELVKANDILSRRGEPGESTAKTDEVSDQTIILSPGETFRAVDLSGPRAITSISVVPLDFGEGSATVDRRARDIQTLRELTIQIAWDNEKTPSVWTPLGDFFGTAPGINTYRTLVMGMSSERLYSHWYMPFAQRAVLELRNDGSETRRLRLLVKHRPEPRAARLLRFHAKWHRDDFATQEAARYQTGDRWPDWPVLIVEGGPGRFCGFHLHIWNPNPLGSKRKAIPGGWGNLGPERTALLDQFVQIRAWWGEGDEKFFVDGEKFPSTFGTGSEDYFGYAFGAFHPNTFDSAFESQPLNDNNYGHISNVRFQIADSVPFQHSFEASIEKFHPNAWPLLYATTAYWYQAAGARDPYGPVPVNQRLKYFVDVKRDTDIYEAEQMEVLHIDSGDVLFDAWSMKFSADHAIVWKNAAKPGDRLVLKLSLEEGGTFDVSAQVGQSPEGGTYRITLDGQVIGDPVVLTSSMAETDPPPNQLFFLSSAYTDRLSEIPLGHLSLSRGNHELAVEAVEPGAHGKWVFPLDFVRFRKR